ncbi:MAG: hypothetical protein ACNS63_10880 [Candidatus Nitrospinota bacterium M3_3B_026]
MSSVNTLSRLSRPQWAAIKAGVVKGLDLKTVHDQVCAEREATIKVVQEAMEKISTQFSTRSRVKREGARIVEDFLKKAREGADVEDMAAVLENAVYRDILRRYADAADPLAAMTMENILKLDLSYRSARLAKSKANGAGGDSEAARIALRAASSAFEKVLSMLRGEARSSAEAARDGFTEWASKTFGAENVKELAREKNEIERLSRLARERAARARRDREGTAGARAASGMAG